MRPLSILNSPTPSSASRLSDGSRHSDAISFTRNRSVPDFEIERPPKSTNGATKRPSMRRLKSDHAPESALRWCLESLITAKSRPFTVSGHIPLDPSALVLFFRSKSGITHSLDFPIDVDYDTPPALDVLIAACRPHSTAGINVVYTDRDSLFYPPNLPLTATLEIANHPILEAVRNALFPNLPTGHYLVAVRDRLEIVLGGCRMTPQPRTLRNDGRVATVCVTLPVHYQGGALVIRNAEQTEERFFGVGGNPEEVEWTAYLAECEYEVETVTEGCRMSISFAVHLKTYGPAVDPLIAPTERFLDLLSDVLKKCRGKKVAFYLTQDYNVNPAEVLAESLVPHLKGSDSLLYHALKVFKLAPELHWAAGGYIWPIQYPVDCGNDLSESPTTSAAMLAGFTGSSLSFSSPSRRSVAVPPMSYYSDSEQTDIIRQRVKESGAVPISKAEITILSDTSLEPMSKEKVYFSSNGELEKLVVNVLLVTYVP